MSTRSLRAKRRLKTTLGKAPSEKENTKGNDVSNLWKPIETSVFGLKHALSLFETATDEVRRLLISECDLIYECRICRNLYRSLANFILHKRNYCCERYSFKVHNGFYNSDTNYNISFDQSKSDNEKSHTNISSKKKKIDSVLERLNEKQTAALLVESVVNSKDVDSNEDDCRNMNREDSDYRANIELESIKETNCAVFQSFGKNLKALTTDGMKNEVMEIHTIFDKDEVILGKDGKIIDYPSRQNNIICTICNQKFLTKKTLTTHIKIKHNESKLVYPCPDCKEVFSNPWCVYRHLYKVHRKTSVQIRRLRDQIQAKAFHINQQERNMKLSHQEPLATSTTTREDVQNEWMENFEGDNDLQMCGGCGRRFERKAALHSHSQLCSKRIAICNTLSTNKAKRTANNDETLEKKLPKRIKTPQTISQSSQEKGSSRRKPIILMRRKPIEKSEAPPSIVTFTTRYRKNLHDESDHKVNDLQPYNISGNTYFPNKPDQSQSPKCLDQCNHDINVEKTPPPIIPTSEKFEKSYQLMNPPTPKSASATSISDDINQIPVNINNDSINNTKEEYGNYADTNKSEKSESVSDTSSDALTPAEEMKMFADRKLHENTNSPLYDTTNVVFNGNSTEGEDSDSELQALFQDETDKTDVQTLGSDILQAAIINDNDNSFQKYDASNEKSNSSLINSFSERETNTSDDSIDSKTSSHASDKGKRALDCDASLPRTAKYGTDMSRMAGMDIDETQLSQKTLDERMSDYINVHSLTCIPCDVAFHTMSTLRCHMARHFNWNRFQCDLCSYMSYDKILTYGHVVNKHLLFGKEKIESAVFNIPEWKSARMSSSDFLAVVFTPVDDDDSKDDYPVVTNTIQTKETPLNDAIEITNKNTELPVEMATEGQRNENIEGISSQQDPEVIKMVMEVIFGNTGQAGAKTFIKDETVTPERSDSIETPPVVENQINSRPVRQRTRCIQKDFLYDMSSLLRYKNSKDGSGDADGKLSKLSRTYNTKSSGKQSDFINEVEFPSVPKLRLRKCEEIYVKCDEQVEK